MDVLALLVGGSPTGLASSLLLSHIGVYSMLFEGEERAPTRTTGERSVAPRGRTDRDLVRHPTEAP